MLNEITKITTKQLFEAANDGENITIIVNGQYYDLDTAAGTDPETAFINGVKFAAAVIEDHRARMNLMFEMNEGRNPKTTKKAYQINEARNKEATNAAGLLEHIANNNGNCFNNWLNDYKRGKFWKLEK